MKKIKIIKIKKNLDTDNHEFERKLNENIFKKIFLHMKIKYENINYLKNWNKLIKY